MLTSKKIMGFEHRHEVLAQGLEISNPVILKGGSILQHNDFLKKIQPSKVTKPISDSDSDPQLHTSNNHWIIVWTVRLNAR